MNAVTSRPPGTPALPSDGANGAGVDPSTRRRACSLPSAPQIAACASPQTPPALRDGRRRQGTAAARPRQVEQALVRHDAIDDAERFCAPGVEHVAKRAQLVGPTVAEDLGQQIA